MKPNKGTIIAVPTQGGSLDLPNGEAESWSSFDVGVAAYQPSVAHVRLVFSDGVSKILRTRKGPSWLRFEHNQRFRYVLFAFNGCVSKVEGLAEGSTVATVGRDCSESGH
jgi:hypothetical protein